MVLGIIVYNLGGFDSSLFITHYLPLSAVREWRFRDTTKRFPSVTPWGSPLPSPLLQSCVTINLNWVVYQYEIGHMVVMMSSKKGLSPKHVIKRPRSSSSFFMIKVTSPSLGFFFGSPRPFRDPYRSLEMVWQFRGNNIWKSNWGIFYGC